MAEPKFELSQGPWPQDPGDVCDLVMKGGVTSGVVYPGAILKLAKRYRFRSIGGASAGAIAAAVTAAAEYGRQVGQGGGFERLRELAMSIATPNFVLERFQPRPETRRAYDLALRAATSDSKGLSLAREVAVDSLWRRRVVLGIAIALWLVSVAAAAYAFFNWMGWWAAIAWTLLLLVAVAGLAVILGIALALIFGSPGLAVKRAIEKRGFGMCPGTSQPGFEDAKGKQLPALSDWLHEEIQRCAGRTTVDDPLTFADLQGVDEDDPRSIIFQLMTTDLSAGRPVRLPLPDGQDNPYLFDPEELAEVIPASVVDWMRKDDTKGSEKISGKELYHLPGKRMPILLATRLSLSFPVLLTAVPFYTRDENVPGERIDHWFSDGGITSNFPIHFFDSFLPGHPTFGLDLMGAPDERLAQIVGTGNDPTLQYVYLPSSPKDAVPLRWSRVEGLLGFFKQVFDAARNWRDTMQMELPGFHERVCHVRLDKEEGGLNLNMGSEVVARLVSRGVEAGAAFDHFNFTDHQFTRYLTLMQQLETELKRTRERFGFDRDKGDDPAWFRARLAATVGDNDYPWSTANDPEWCRNASEATQALLELAAEWGAKPPPSLGFDREKQTPAPRPTMRITPQV